jgi:tetratricopeptide (TPR) repeat protein
MAQALFELRKVTELAPELRSAVVERAFRWTPDFANLLRIVPEGAAGIAQLNAIAQRLAGAKDHAELRDKLLRHSFDRNPNEPQTNAIYAQDLFGALENPSSACQGDSRTDCEIRLRQHVATVLRGTKDPQLSTLLSAQLLVFDKKLDEAEQLLADRCQTLPNPSQCEATRVNYALKLTDPARFNAACDAYIAAACATPTSCSDAYAWLGNLEAARNNLLAALARYERAAQESPSIELWLRVADTALKLGRIGRAHTAMSAARRLGSSANPLNIDQRLEELQRARLLEESRVSPSSKR